MAEVRRKHAKELEERMRAMGTAEEAWKRDLTLKVEAERQAKVDHLQKVAARRIGQMNLARGWSAWHGPWAEQRRRQRRLRSGAGRLVRPHLARSLRHWLDDWRFDELARRKKAAAEAHEQRRGKLAGELGQVRDDLVAMEAAVSEQKEQTEQEEMG